VLFRKMTGEFDEACPNSETPQDPPALSAKEPNETKLADPEYVRRFLARAKRLLASSPETQRDAHDFETHSLELRCLARHGPLSNGLKRQAS
jgi:hypothetical protein